MKDWVLPSPWDPTVWVVDHRIVNIIPQGTMLQAGEILSYEHIFFVQFDKPCIHETSVYLIKPFHNHAKGAYALYDDEEILVEGVRKWTTVEIPFEGENLKKLRDGGYKAGLSSDGTTRYWEIKARIFIERSGEDMKVGFDIFKPAPPGNVKNEESSGDEAEFEDEVAMTITDTVWEAAHSEFFE